MIDAREAVMRMRNMDGHDACMMTVDEAADLIEGLTEGIRMSRRVGRFAVGLRSLDDDWQDLAVLIGNTGAMIIRCESRMDRRCLDYSAYCDQFDEVDDGEVVPWYLLTLDGVFHRAESFVVSPTSDPHERLNIHEEVGDG